MRGLISFLASIIVISLLVCIVGWIFTTDFLIFDIILVLALFALDIAIPIVVLILIIWVILELFR